MNTTKFRDAEIGNTYDMTLLVTKIEQRSTKKGDPYVRLGLSDGSTEADCNLFNNNTAESLANNGITMESAVNVRLKCTEYNSLKNYTVDSIAPARLSEDELGQLVRMPPVSPKTLMVDVILKVKQSSGRPYDLRSADIPDTDYSLTALTVRILWKYRSKFYTSSAAKSMHHNLYGGLVYHTSRMCSCASQIADVYQILDKELLVCGTALHDVGKIKELNTSGLGAATYSVDGRLFGHSVIGLEMIDEEVGRADTEAGHPTYDREKVRLLKHMIASHHGTLEWGALTVPAIPEAMVLHNIDMIDSRMYMYEDGLASILPGDLSEPLFGIAEDGKATIYKAKNAQDS